MLTLLGSPHSQFTYKIALALRLGAAPFAFRYVDFSRRVHMEQWFLDLSRWGQAPVLVHKGKALVQSGAILEYLADALGLLVVPGAMQCVREWLYWNADRLAPPIYGLYGAKLGQLGLLPISVDPIIYTDHQNRAHAAFLALDAALRKRAFLTGDRLTGADVSCYAELAFARLADLDLAPYPEVSRWGAQIEALPRYAAPLSLLARHDIDFA